ncbi:MAG: hypothetical protein ACFE9L_14825 [Candidatus Hodarchaeota archaeon]
MGQKVFRNRFNVLVSTILIFMLFILFEINSQVLMPQLFLNTPINFIRYLPILFLVYIFVDEIYQSIFQDTFTLRIKGKGEGIIFIQNYETWIAIFETISLEKVQVNELEQLRHLKIFSLELDNDKLCLRVFLYSKSYEELLDRMNTSKPILENVLPGIKLVQDDIIAQFLGDYSLLKINNTYLLKNKTDLIIPQPKDVVDTISFSFSKMILSWNLSTKDTIQENSRRIYPIQLYFLICHRKSSFFKCIDEITFREDYPEESRFLDVLELQRVRLRYQIYKFPKMELETSLNSFKIALTSVLSNNTQIIGEKKASQLLSDVTRITTEKKVISSNNDCENRIKLKGAPQKIETGDFKSRINQICIELCNIPKDPVLLLEEKGKRCHRRANFCNKLLRTENFSTLLEDILMKVNEAEKLQLIAELNRNLSFYQLVCVLAHVNKYTHPKISYQKLISLIHMLIKSNSNNKRSNICKQGTYHMPVRDEMAEKYDWIYEKSYTL